MRVPAPRGTEPCVDNTLTNTAASVFSLDKACSVQFNLVVRSNKGLKGDCLSDRVNAKIFATTEYAKDWDVS